MDEERHTAVSGIEWIPLGLVNKLMRHWLDGKERKLRVRKLELEIKKLKQEDPNLTISQVEVLDAVTRLVREVVGLRLEQTQEGPVVIREASHAEIPKLQKQLLIIAEQSSIMSGSNLENNSTSSEQTFEEAGVIWEEDPVVETKALTELQELEIRIAARRRKDNDV